MFKTFFLTELRYTLKQPMVYIFLGLLALLTFGATSSDSVMIGGSVGNVLRNSPHVVTIYTTVMSLFGLLIATAFFNNAALRDYSSGFNEILFSTPLSKPGFFFGRFFGALLLSTVPMLGVFLGSIIGSIVAPAAGWIDASRFGPAPLQTFISSYFIFVLPNMFFAGTVIFAMANKWKSTVISFVGSLLIIVGYIVSGTLLSDIDNETIAALTDTFGIRAYSLFSKYFTPIEKNTISPSFTGLLLYNRLIWVGLGFGVLLLSYFNFSFQQKNKKVKAEKAKEEKEEFTGVQPEVQASYGSSTEWLHFKSFLKINFLSIVKSTTFRILFIFNLILLVSSLFGGFEYFGLKSYPLTYKVLDDISGSSGIFIIIILVFFSGELIWHDRDNKINEVVDATPHTSFISLIAKALSIVGATTVLYFSFIIIGIGYQLLNGYTRIELDVYLIDFLYTQLPIYLIWSGFMIFIQVMVNNKYIGYFISILIIFIWEIVLSVADIQSNMISIGGSPSLTYSDLNGFGPGVLGKMWFNLYWILFSAVCILLAGILWVRGNSVVLKERILNARKKIPKTYFRVLTVLFVLWIATAGFVYYNTQVLNPYKSSDEFEEMAVEYEKTYKKYQNVNLPKITEVKYQIDIFPNERDLKIQAQLTYTNQSNKPIDSLHYTIDEDWSPEFNIPNSKLVFEDENFGYLIYQLSPALQPGESLDIEIKTSYITKGFENQTGNTSIVKNGTFINNFSILPTLGYNESIELSDKNKRKKFDLKPKDRMPELEENCSANCMANYLSNGQSDYINVETIISTSSDQIAIAPGSLIKQWEENGRNYYQYKVDHPSQNFYSFISANYEVAKRKWNDVDIEVYYDSKHSVNIEKMLDAVERSLAYYTENFGPYYHKQCRIIEFPRYANFAQAFPGTMPYSESFGFVIDLEDETDNNVIDAVIAHEMAHQWWAHQVVGANMQGGTMMSESFAEYSSLMTMKSISSSPMKMREFLKYDHDRYLRGRSGETDKELPLYKVENQQYIHYGKGSVILYALQDFIGEDKVNSAMKSFLEEFRYKEPPYPTSLDFMKHLEPQVPDSLKYFITDWFKEITLYDFRMKEAKYEELENGKFEVSLNIEAYKIKADTIGNETKVPVNEWVDLGFFADDDEKDLMFQKRVLINQNEAEFTFQLDSLPAKAAIDPRMIYIDRVYKDNIKSVSALN